MISEEFERGWQGAPDGEEKKGSGTPAKAASKNKAD